MSFYEKLKVLPKVMVVTLNLNMVCGVVVEVDKLYLAIGDSHNDPYPTIVPFHAITQIITDPKLLEKNDGPIATH